MDELPEIAGITLTMEIRLHNGRVLRASTGVRPYPIEELHAMEDANVFNTLDKIAEKEGGIHPSEFMLYTLVHRLRTTGLHGYGETTLVQFKDVLEKLSHEIKQRMARERTCGVDQAGDNEVLGNG